MLRLVFHHLKTKNIRTNEVKKFLFVIMYVLDWYKTQEKCDKTVLENDGTLKFVCYDCCKNLKMCNEAVDNYPHALDCLPHRYKSQKVRKRAVDTILVDSVRD